MLKKTSRSSQCDIEFCLLAKVKLGFTGSFNQMKQASSSEQIQMCSGFSDLCFFSRHLPYIYIKSNITVKLLHWRRWDVKCLDSYSWFWMPSARKLFCSFITNGFYDVLVATRFYFNNWKQLVSNARKKKPQTWTITPAEESTAEHVVDIEGHCFTNISNDYMMLQVTMCSPNRCTQCRSYVNKNHT